MSSPERTLPSPPFGPAATGTSPGLGQDGTSRSGGAGPDVSDEIVLQGRAMATAVTVRVPVPDTAPPGRRHELEAAARSALAVFGEVEVACTRFDPDSPLMRANRSPDRWHRVPHVLLVAIAEAKRAYDATGGRVDPRILRQLVALGYDRTLPFGRTDIRLEPAPQPRGTGGGAHPSGAWRPRLRHGTGEVLIGADPIDLGGIGKGLAVRLAAARLARVGADYLVDAGGDCTCAGEAPGGGPWLVGVEDPASPGPGGEGEPSGPLAVLAVSNRAVTTSSTRLRRWRAAGAPVHHLIDPRTGRPGGAGLLAVTVVGDDPAVAEAWSKALFLAGRHGIAELARRRQLAALWIDDRRQVDLTAGMGRYVRWQR